MILPDKITAASIGDPRFMVMYGREKSGKSSLVAQLPNSLAVDFEIAPGYKFIDAVSAHVPSLKELWDLYLALEKYKEENGKNKYKYIVLDHGSTLEDLAWEYAEWQYKKSPMGKDFTGKLMFLPNGAGYLHLRNAVIEFIERFQRCCDTVILVCHTNHAQININGTEQSEMSMQMTGKLRQILGGRADAIGFLYRDGNKNILNFKTDGDFVTEARPQHLRGKQIILGESDENNVITTHWEEVFTELKK